MQYQLAPYGLALLGMAGLCLVMAHVVINRHMAIGAKTYALLMLSLTVWLLSYALESARRLTWLSTYSGARSPIWAFAPCQCSGSSLACNISAAGDGPHLPGTVSSL